MTPAVRSDDHMCKAVLVSHQWYSSTIRNVINKSMGKIYQRHHQTPFIAFRHTHVTLFPSSYSHRPKPTGFGIQCDQKIKENNFSSFNYWLCLVICNPLSQVNFSLLKKMDGLSVYFVSFELSPLLEALIFWSIKKL